MYKPTPLSLHYPPLGVGFLSSFIKQHTDWKTSIIDAACDNIQQRLKQDKPDVIGISSSTLEFHETILLAEKIQEDDGIPIMIGGHHVTALPHMLQDCFDVGILGEGEETLVELLNLFEKDSSKMGWDNKKLKKIKGLVFHRNKERINTGRRELIKPLDKVGVPDYDSFNLKYYLRKQDHFPRKFGKGMSMMTSRGCPYNCVFCGSSHFWKVLRYNSPEYSVDVMKFLIEKYNVKYINIFDDIFAVNIERLKKIVDLVREEGIHEKVEFGIQGRANMMSDKVCELLKKMNVYYIGFGLESGNERVLKYLKRGTVTVEDNRNAVKQCKKHGFAMGSGFMLGNPEETEEEMNDTLKFIKGNDMDSCTAYITTPLPGTELWEYAKKQGLVSDNMDWNKINQFFHGDNVILSKMDKEKFSEIYKKVLGACTISKVRSNISHPISLGSYFLKNPSMMTKVLKQLIGV